MTATLIGGMRFSVDAWDPSYGPTTDDLGESNAQTVLDLEQPRNGWRPVPARPGAPLPPAVLFVDGVRRIDALVWVEEAAGAGSAATGLCASYAAGVVCSFAGRAQLVQADVRRGLFTAARATDIDTRAGRYTAVTTPARPGTPAVTTLSLAVQVQLAEAEIATAVAARDGLADRGVPTGSDLLVVDGPLRGRQHLPRTIGFIKTHHASYLPPDLHALVGRLGAGERTPVFLVGSSWQRHTWYLRLPGLVGAPWAGVVRVECGAAMPVAEVVALADLSQATLCRYASVEYKDPRAPQNLYPIGGLEKELRHRLGDQRVLYRALRVAAA